jgi:hypothetical protein
MNDAGDRRIFIQHSVTGPQQRGLSRETRAAIVDEFRMYFPLEFLPTVVTRPRRYQAQAFEAADILLILNGTSFSRLLKATLERSLGAADAYGAFKRLVARLARAQAARSKNTKIAVYLMVEEGNDYVALQIVDLSSSADLQSPGADAVTTRCVEDFVARLEESRELLAAAAERIAAEGSGKDSGGGEHVYVAKMDPRTQKLVLNQMPSGEFFRPQA